MRIRLLIVASLTFSLSMPVAFASAQGSEPSEADTERARALFAEGVELAAEESYIEAVERFRAAYALRPAPAIAYNLALSLGESGQAVEAWNLVQAVLADEESGRPVRRQAQALQADLDSAVGRVRIAVAGALGDATVDLDGRLLGHTELQGPIGVLPGSHTVTARRGTSTLETQRTNVAGGEEVTVALDPATWSVVDPELLEPTEPVEPVDTGPAFYETWWFWAVVGVVVVVGLAVGIGVAASGTEGPVNGLTNPPVVTFP